MKRALISVYNKEGIIEFATSLDKLGWEIISTGGTSKVLKEAGLNILEVEDITKFPEILDGRVKTLNPYIHGGLLYKRDDANHIKTIDDMAIGAIDLVVNNLYPFEETVNREGVSQEEIIENIDIGGPSMIRAAAKNYRFVSVVVDPKDYGLIIDELNSSDKVSEETNRYLAAKVFNYTANYDALIAKYFNEISHIDFPETLTLTYKKEQSLRYGENPHQAAAFYREFGDVAGSLAAGKQLHGKELSFNNINDANGALKTLKEFDEPTVVAVKHANPCGIGSGETLKEAYIKAYECDKVSIFGGIVAANRVIEKEVAEMINSIFLEVVLAPGFTDEALEILTGKKKIRLIQIDNIEKEIDEMDTKKVFGGLLIQERDKILLLDDIEIVTKRGPSEKELDDLIFAWKAAKNINSNGVVLARDKATIGIGLGEVNRVWAVDEAIERGREKIEGSVMASDGFFPFKDSIELLAKNGVKAVIQPGGSIRDDEVIEEADKNGMAMIFTGIRHFKH